jgi:SagB-type dehydrogenase family enzyme
MSIRTETISAARLLHRTLDGVADLFADDGHGDEDVAGRAGYGKVYRDVPRIRLPRPDAANLGRPGLGARRISALLGYGYGLGALVLGPSSAWPYHRTVASARCLYPTEVYPYLTTGGDGGPAGLYHYDPLHHGLARLRGPEAGPGLAAVLGRDLAGPALIVTSVFWRTAYRYRTYAYRLCSQEAGLVVGNLVAVAEALGLRAAVCYRFVDAAAAHLLGCSPGQESPFAVVTLAAPDTVDALPAAGGPDADRLPAITGGGKNTVRVDGLGAPRPQEYPDLLAVDRDSARTRPDVDPVAIVDDDPRPVTPDAPPTMGQLAEWVLARESGAPNLLPALDPLDAGDLVGVLAALDRPYRTDLRSPGWSPPVAVHVVANRVNGLPAGVYRWCRGGELSLVEAGPMAARLHAVTNSFNLNYRLAPAVVYVSVDTGRYLAALGSRGYRVCHLESGVLVQWMCVAAAARGWLARVSNGCDVSAVRALLGLADPAVSPLFQVLLARRRPGARCRVAVMG